MTTLLPRRGVSLRAFWASASMWDAHMSVELEDRASAEWNDDDDRCHRAQASMRKAVGR